MVAGGREVPGGDRLAAVGRQDDFDHVAVLGEGVVERLAADVAAVPFDEHMVGGVAAPPEDLAERQAVGPGFLEAIDAEAHAAVLPPRPPAAGDDGTIYPEPAVSATFRRMLLPRFDVVEPESVAAALEALADSAVRSRAVAGGTDVVPDLKREYDRRLRFPALPAFRPGPFPERLVSLLRLSELRGVRVDAGGTTCGPLATMSELAADGRLAGPLAALADGAASVGSPQVRNRATLGGNLCNARPCADTAPPVVALDGMLTLASRGGRREVRARDFFTGPGQTVLAPGELLTAVRFPPQPPGCGSAALKLGVRRAYEIAIVSAAAWVALEGDRVRSARVVFGSAAPVPLWVEATDLAGKAPDEAALRAAARVAAAQTKPIDDFRASAAYRRQAAEVLAFRVLERAVARARGAA